MNTKYYMLTQTKQHDDEALLRTQAERNEMQDDYRAEKRAEGDDEVRESRRHADEALGYEHG